MMNLQHLANMGRIGDAAMYSLAHGADIMRECAALSADGEMRVIDRITDSMQSHACMDRSLRGDMPNIPIFAQALEHIFEKVYETEFNNLPMANGEILPHDNSVPNTAETWKYRTIVSQGTARFGNVEAYGSIPMVSIGGREFSGNVAAVLNGFGYSIQEMRNMAAVGGELEAMYPKAAKRAHDELFERVAWWGDKIHHLHGFLTHPNMPVVYAPVGSGNSTKWKDKTFDEVFADIVYLATAASDRTYGRAVTTMILIPRDVHTLMLTLRIENTGETLWMHIQNNFSGDIGGLPKVEFKIVDQLNAKHPWNPLGVGIACAIVVDKDSGSLIVPQEFEMFDPRWEGLRWITPCHSRLGGARVPRPYEYTVMPGVS